MAKLSVVLLIRTMRERLHIYVLGSNGNCEKMAHVNSLLMTSTAEVIIRIKFKPPF